jgi:DNA-binding response OmpR family regulator
VADDDPLLLSLLEHKLQAAGYNVHAVNDGAEALDAAEAQRPALIILDAMMPVIDGFEALRRLKDDPALRATPVVMLTALKQEEHVVGALKLGAADFLPKPFIPDELVARIQRLLPSAA